MNLLLSQAQLNFQFMRALDRLSKGSSPSRQEIADMSDVIGDILGLLEKVVEASNGTR